MTIEARWAVLGLALMGVVAIGGVIALSLTDHTIPDVLTVVIGGALTGIAGILVPSSSASPIEGKHEKPNAG